MRTFLRLCAVVACVLLLGGTASAWEFTMSGAYTWEYEHISQMGDQGFFGPQNIDNSTGADDLAPLFGWYGGHLPGGGLSTGADAAAASQYAEFNMQLRLNKAIRIRGMYYVGGWDTPGAATSQGAMAFSEYYNSQAYGVYRSFSPGYWNTMWLSAQTPMGLLVFGKRPGGFGPGLVFDGEDEVPSESLLIHVPYGPMSMGFYWYPWRRGLGTGYPNLPDRNGIREPHVGTYLTYGSGPFSFGAGVDYIRMHKGPEAETTAAARVQAPPFDRLDIDGTVHAKYNNGRFFWNAELAYYSRTDRWQASERLAVDAGDAFNGDPAQIIGANGSGAGSRFAPDYYEHWTAMSEMGIYAGPAKMSFLWAWSPGPDRRNGVIIDRQTWVPSGTFDSSVSVYRPYSYLLGYTYGAGNNSYTYSSVHGFIYDANVLAGRLDYAVAANLNLYGSFLWADRVSQGYGWGWIRPDTAAGNYGQVEYATQGDGFAFNNTANNTAPAIPDSNLGYEIGFGVDWKLLEGLTFASTFAYWQPGKWFNYACVDRSVANWDDPVAANNYGTNPVTDVDPVYGMEILLTGEF